MKQVNACRVSLVFFICKLKFFSLVFQSFFTLWYICFLSLRCLLYFSGKETRTGSKCPKILIISECHTKKIGMMRNYLGASFFSNCENQMAEPIHLIWNMRICLMIGKKYCICTCIAFLHSVLSRRNLMTVRLIKPFSLSSGFYTLTAWTLIT